MATEPDEGRGGASAVHRVKAERGRHLIPWALVCGYAVLIFFLSSIPSPRIPSPRLVDKAYHVIEYWPFGTLLYIAIGGMGIPRGRAAWLAGLIATFYGATDEFHQLFVPGRSADGLDLVADAIGAFLGSASGLWLGFYRRP